MNESLLTLALLILGAALIGAWFAHRRAVERAIVVCRDACARAEVQLLDHGVRFQGLRWRDGGLQRGYAFDYSRDGVERLTGRLWMRGDWAEYVDFDERDRHVLLSLEARPPT